MSAKTLIEKRGVDITILHKSEAVDSGLSPTQAYSTAFTTKGFVQDSSGDESVRYGGEANRRRATIFVEVDLDISEGDRVTVDGRVFDIETARTRKATGRDRLSHTVLECQETEPV